MPTTPRANGAADIVRLFIERNELADKDAETIVSRLITSVLHFAMQAGEIDGDDGRMIALAAARIGLGRFVTDVHAVPGAPPPEVYTLITLRTEGGTWVSETGYQEVITCAPNAA